MAEFKGISFSIPTEKHTQIKLRAISRNQSMTQYLLSLVDADIANAVTPQTAPKAKVKANGKG